MALLDRQLGDGRFRAAIDAHGLDRNADFMRGLKGIADLLKEDALGGLASDAAGETEEDAYEGLRHFFK